MTRTPVTCRMASSASFVPVLKTMRHSFGFTVRTISGCLSCKFLLTFDYYFVLNVYLHEVDQLFFVIVVGIRDQLLNSLRCLIINDCIV